MANPASSSPRRPSSRRRTGRRSPLASVALLLIGLLATGGAYAAFTSSATAQTPASAQAQVSEGKKLFEANCASCHGIGAVGTAGVAPSLVGVGAAAVDFQVGTGRMPMAASGPQAEEKPAQFTDKQIAEMAAYIASLSPGPAIPTADQLKGGDVATGAELFRVNCAMCHNVAGAGGALTEGKYAPPLTGVSAKHVYEAMVTGPQNMPVFNDLNITPKDKAAIIAYLQYLDDHPSPGGLDLGNLGPVSEGLFVWIFALGAVVVVTIWLTAKSN
jgi:ubiquinol-cytochrome c reductase cytochrome c subunit